MPKDNSTAVTDIKVQQERTHFQYMLAKNPNYFGNIPGSDLKPNMKLIAEASYEQLTCVGYNPDTGNMEATFSVKQSAGYAGDLCSAGSLEYIRFYMDLHDGHGFIDQGSVAINVHDIPQGKDCKGNLDFPILYVGTLMKKSSSFFYCEKPVLPTLRAILSWSFDPPVNSPNWQPVWGSVLDGDIQLKPSPKIFLKANEALLATHLNIAAVSPHLSNDQITEITGVNTAQLNTIPEAVSLADLIKESEKSKVPATRFAFKSIANMIKFPSSEITLQDKATLSAAKIDISKIIDQIALPIPHDTSKANVDFEELECIGLDYNSENLVATIKIKKNVGYNTDLCSAGSKEYISFWINWNTPCEWKYINTMQLNAYNIQMKGNSLQYSVSLPLDANIHRMLCNNPNIVTVRGVLSWNVPPSTTDPNKLEYYGNRVDAHVQIKPGKPIDPNNPLALFNTIGGIDIDHVNDATGLTKPNSVFAFNALPVPTGAPFGGEIVITMPYTFPGKYRFKITNLNDSTFYYLQNTLSTLGWSPIPPYSAWYSQTPDMNNFYNFRTSFENTLGILARFTPGTDARLKVELEVMGVAQTFSKTIQMDNTYPVIHMVVDDGGDCTRYKKGDTIKVTIDVYDLNISSWGFSSTWGGNSSGTNNIPPTVINILTPGNAYPCGSVNLSAVDKTIVDSQGVGHYVNASYNICLKDK